MGSGSGELDAGGVSAHADIVRRADGRYELTLRISGASMQAERSLSAGNCDAAVQAAALLVAMALDPTLQARRAAATPTRSQAAAPPAPEATRAPGAQSAAAAAGAGKLGFAIAVGALVDVGSLPSPGFGLGADLELHLAPVRVSLGATVLPAIQHDVTGLPGARLEIAVVAASARMCLALPLQRFELGPCGWLEVGSMHGDVHGIRLPHSDASLWLAPGAGARARFRIGSGWSAGADVGAIVPYARRRFFVQTDGGVLEVHRVAQIALQTELGLAYEFQ